MKKLLLVAMAMFIAVSTVHASQKIEDKGKNSRLCKVFTQKVKAYKAHMRNDHYAKVTLASYEKRAASFCSTKH